MLGARRLNHFLDVVTLLNSAVLGTCAQAAAMVARMESHQAADFLAKMKPSAAVELLANTDHDQKIDILNNLDVNSSGAVFSKMKARARRRAPFAAFVPHRTNTQPWDVLVLVRTCRRPVKVVCTLGYLRKCYGCLGPHA